MVELIYDVHASESGALAILDDLYKRLVNSKDKFIKYVFVVSTPYYDETENIEVLRFPWVKKSWFHRLYFNKVTTRKIIKIYKPDKIYSLQNEGISFYHGIQEVYLHLPFILCDYRFSLKKDGKRLWLYQNILSRNIFKSLRKVNKVIVQTQWMKEALINKTGIKQENIEVEAPDITVNVFGKFKNKAENRRRFFYPATAFHYKNHITILKAINYAVEQGLLDYEVIFTVNKDENKYTKELYKYVEEYNLNVKFNGPMSREKVFELYTRSVLLFPSFVESFGLPLLEARKCNTYVIASNCPFCREVLKDYEKARFFEALDYRALGELICKIAMN